MYRVVVDFIDRKDGGHKYRVGDAYPRAGYAPKEIRIAELSGTANQRGVALIKEVIEKPVEKPTEAPAETDKPKKGRKKNAE